MPKSIASASTLRWSRSSYLISNIKSVHRFKRVIVLGLAVCTSALPLTFTSKAYAAGTVVVDSTAGSLCKTGPYTAGNYAQQFPCVMLEALTID
jgi:hypothetical protein